MWPSPYSEVHWLLVQSASHHWHLTPETRPKYNLNWVFCLVWWGFHTKESINVIPQSIANMHFICNNVRPLSDLVIGRNKFEVLERSIQIYLITFLQSIAENSFQCVVENQHTMNAIIIAAIRTKLWNTQCVLQNHKNMPTICYLRIWNPCFDGKHSGSIGFIDRRAIDFTAKRYLYFLWIFQKLNVYCSAFCMDKLDITYMVPGLGVLCSNCGLLSEDTFLMNILHKLFDELREAMLLKINRDIFVKN